MSAQYTPGPWRLSASPSRPTIIYGPDRWAIVSCDTYHGRAHPEQEMANARLIAAAPELLEALQYAVGVVPELASVPGIAGVIAKATRGQS